MVRLAPYREAGWFALAIVITLSAGCGKTSKVAQPVLPQGAIVEVRMLDSLDTSTSRAGDGFRAVLATPLTMNGRTLVSAGAPVHGFVQKSASSSRAAGRSMLAIGLRSLEIDRRHVELETHSIARVSGDHKKRSMIPVSLAPAEHAEVRIPAGSILVFRLRQSLAL